MIGPRVIVVGAGPAGLTAAVELQRRGATSVVLESDSIVGGISRTEERHGYRFDLGGHRFFTRVERVERFWRETLPAGDFLKRPRMSRILYRGRLFDYPLRPGNALWRLGFGESCRCVLSYLAVRISPPTDQDHFEGWVSARFGRRLYEIFFKTYTEKVWGMPADQISADWAAQRIKDLSLGRAVLDAFGFGKGRPSTSLIEEFDYPRLGPGMMWERAAEQARVRGADVRLNTPVAKVIRTERGATAVVTAGRDGGSQVLPLDHLVSSMPLNHLVEVMDPPAPWEVRRAATALRHRDFLIVALVCRVDDVFPDNWIYIHTPGVAIGRVQNYGSWSPDMVKEGTTCLGVEYFVGRDEDLWHQADDELVRLAAREVAELGLIQHADVEAGYVVRVPRAYPVYDHGYQKAVATIRRWLELAVPNVHPVGRNGMHKYNNQDHSMLTAMLTVENICEGAHHDVWSVNVEAQYHEERLQPRALPRTDPKHALTLSDRFA